MPSDPDDIFGWQRIDPRITTSGRLEPADPVRLAAIGVRRVINLALDSSPGALADEAGLVADAGMAYLHIPVPFDAPEKRHYAAFRTALADPTPVHVHCMMNWRVSAFFYRYHRDAGIEEPTARATMEQQWSPETYSGKEARVWARFVRGED